MRTHTHPSLRCVFSVNTYMHMRARLHMTAIALVGGLDGWRECAKTLWRAQCSATLAKIFVWMCVPLRVAWKRGIFAVNAIARMLLMTLNRLRDLCYWIRNVCVRETCVDSNVTGFITKYLPFWDLSHKNRSVFVISNMRRRNQRRSWMSAEWAFIHTYTHTFGRISSALTFADIISERFMMETT